LPWDGRRTSQTQKRGLLVACDDKFAERREGLEMDWSNGSWEVMEAGEAPLSIDQSADFVF